MKIKVSEAKGAILDWLVATALGTKPEDIRFDGRRIYRWLRDEDGELDGSYMTGPEFLFSSLWEAGGPIIDREDISVIKLEPLYGVDAAGYTNSKVRIPVFGAVIGECFCVEQQRDSYGDACGEICHVGTELITTGPTKLIAAMRCFVSSKLGDGVEIPKELK